jgi:SPX domain protein involved in polyphosphate accumulation
MLFGVKLSNEIYPPWHDHYINYEKLKKLLKENALDIAKKNKWSDNDESQFVKALDAELEKVYGFQSSQYSVLSQKIDQLEKQADEINALQSKDSVQWTQFHQELENSLAEAHELDHFARLNFTGFQKIVKKHDRLHPQYNSVKALFSIRLKDLPFHSEDYSPLLHKISFLFQFLRENMQTGSHINSSMTPRESSVQTPSGSYVNADNLEYQSFKFWVHPDNLMEVKTTILRHLPVLVYANESEAKESADPIVTSLYFDNSSFELYNMKLMKANTSPSLRLRWSGNLSDKPDIFLEKKTVDKSDEDETSHDIRLKLKEKYLNDFVIKGDVDLFKQKTLHRFREMGSSEQILKGIEQDIDAVAKLLKEYDLQPAVRSVYTRTAFQIPGDDRVRITIDSDILFIREDAFDEMRPIRDPNEWHRTDIDQDIDDKYSVLRKNEFSKFPHSVMEIKIKNTSGRKASDANGISIPFSRKNGKWIEELTTSHLVKEVPNFSKFIQGIASLFIEDDRLDILPFWLPELEDDIRKNPNDAMEEELKKKMTKTDLQSRLRRIESNKKRQSSQNGGAVAQEEYDEDQESSDGDQQDVVKRRKHKPVEIIPFLTGGSKLANVDSEDEELELPPGVLKPKTLLKQAGSMKVETKVWLANERTFNRWLNVCTLFSALTFSIYSAVKKSSNETLATNLAYTYFALTLFCLGWGYFIYQRRLTLIRARDGKHLDAPLGPLIVAAGVLVAITVNFIVGFKSAAERLNVMEEPLHPLIQWVLESVWGIVGARGH